MGEIIKMEKQRFCDKDFFNRQKRAYDNKINHGFKGPRRGAEKTDGR